MPKGDKITPGQRKVIEREWERKSVSQLARQLSLSEEDVRRAVDALSSARRPKASGKRKKPQKQGAQKEPSGKGAATETVSGSSITWRRALAAAVLLAVVVGGVYANGLGAQFTLDDRHSIVNNPSVRDAGNIGKFFTEPQTFSILPGRRMFRPLLLISYLVNYSISGYDPTGWHVFNLGIHWFSSLLVAGIALLLTRRRWLALGAGLAFAVHPVNTEVVDYVSGRSASLAGAFFFGSFLLHRLWRGKGELKACRWAAVAAYAVGLLVKENVIVLPAVMWLSDRLLDKDRKESLLDDVRRYAPFAVVAAMYLVVRGAALGLDTVAVDNPVRGYGSNLLTQLSVLVYYLRLILWPNDLNIYHYFPEFSTLWKAGAPVWTWPAVSIVILAGIASAVVRSRNRIAMLGGAWCIISLLPETLIPLNQLVAERRLYVPLVGLLLVVGVMAERLLRSPRKRDKRALAVAMAALVALFSMLTVHRNYVYSSEKRLWQDAVSKAPQSENTYQSLGYVYEQEGWPEKALRQWRTAHELAPRNPDIMRNLAVALNKTGQHRRALDLMRKALEIEPNSAHGYYNLGSIYISLGEMDRAEAAFRKAIEISPGYTTPYNNLAVILINKGEYEKARRMLEKTLSIDPHQPTARENLNRLLREHFGG